MLHDLKTTLNLRSLAPTFIRSLMLAASLILWVVSSLKLISALSKVPVLAVSDPVLTFLSNKQVLLLAGSLEFFVATLIALNPGELDGIFALLAICGTFVLYRAGLLMLGTHPPCPCLGRASDWLHLAPQQTNTIAVVILIVLICIAVSSLILYAMAKHKSPSTLHGE